MLIGLAHNLTIQQSVDQFLIVYILNDRFFVCLLSISMFELQN